MAMTPETPALDRKLCREMLCVVERSPNSAAIRSENDAKDCSEKSQLCQWKPPTKTGRLSCDGIHICVNRKLDLILHTL